MRFDRSSSFPWLLTTHQLTHKLIFEFWVRRFYLFGGEPSNPKRGTAKANKNMSHPPSSSSIKEILIIVTIIIIYQIEQKDLGVNWLLFQKVQWTAPDGEIADLALDRDGMKERKKEVIFMDPGQVHFIRGVSEQCTDLSEQTTVLTVSYNPVFTIHLSAPYIFHSYYY